MRHFPLVSQNTPVVKVIVIQCGATISPYQDGFEGKIIGVFKSNSIWVQRHRHYRYKGKLATLVGRYKRYEGEQVGNELFIYVSNVDKE